MEEELRELTASPSSPMNVADERNKSSRMVRYEVSEDEIRVTLTSF